MSHMSWKRVDIDPALLSAVERIGKKEGVSVSQIVNEALAIVLAERTHRLQAPRLTTLPRTAPSRRLDRDEILSVLDF